MLLTTRVILQHTTDFKHDDTSKVTTSRTIFRVSPETWNTPGRVVIFHVVKILPNADVVYYQIAPVYKNVPSLPIL